VKIGQSINFLLLLNSAFLAFFKKNLISVIKWWRRRNGTEARVGNGKDHDPGRNQEIRKR